MIDFRRSLGLRTCLCWCAGDFGFMRRGHLRQPTFHQPHRAACLPRLPARTKQPQDGTSTRCGRLTQGVTLTHYAVDTWGKCHDCSLYEALPYGIDTLWVAGQTLNVDLQDSLLWTVEVDEGLSWIRFDQRLDLVPTYFE